MLSLKYLKAVHMSLRVNCTYLLFCNLPSLVQLGRAKCRTSIRLLGCYDHLNSNNKHGKYTNLNVIYQMTSASNKKEKHTAEFDQTYFPVLLSEKTKH